MHSTGAYTNQQIQARLNNSGEYLDTCFCDTLTGATEVSLLSQYTINQWQKNNKPEGRCPILQTACGFGCRVITCSKLGQPEKEYDATQARINRCCKGALCVLCAPVSCCWAASHVLKANTQVQIIQGPSKQTMNS